MTPLETMQRASAKIRALAWEATPGVWEHYPRSHGGPVVAAAGSDGDPVPVAKVYANLDDTVGNAQHIASWHPDVALAVADVLDNYADFLGVVERRFGANVADHLVTGGESGHADRLLHLARTYLGESE